jgi:hypothetical protein
LKLESQLEDLEVLKDFDLLINHVNWKLPIKFLYYWKQYWKLPISLPMLPIPFLKML